MIPDPSGAIGGALAPWNGMQRFRDRMLHAYGIGITADGQAEESMIAKTINNASAQPQRDTTGRRRRLRVIFIHNKRFDAEDRRHINAAISR